MRGLGSAGAGDLTARPRAALSSGISACSGCAGDYEDPDRTAWLTEEVTSEAEEEERASEFPDRVPDRKN